VGREKCTDHGVTDCLACSTAARRKDTLRVADAIEANPIPTVPEFPAAEAEQPGQVGIIVPTETLTFDVLPMDDSRTSKVVRAAADYAKASADLARAIVAVEQLKAQLLVEEAKLNAAKSKQEHAWKEMYDLTREGI
jgi:hypothetical protein